jgi:hypothetical protein
MRWIFLFIATLTFEGHAAMNEDTEKLKKMIAVADEAFPFKDLGECEKLLQVSFAEPTDAWGGAFQVYQSKKVANPLVKSVELRANFKETKSSQFLLVTLVKPIALSEKELENLLFAKLERMGSASPHDPSFGSYSILKRGARQVTVGTAADEIAAKAIDSFNFSVSTEGRGAEISTAEDAVSVATYAWLARYGEKVLEKKPFNARLEKDVWIVEGTLGKGPGGTPRLGGTPHAEIAKSNGRVLNLTHGQ